jgi:hypothetical protein
MRVQFAEGGLAKPAFLELGRDPDLSVSIFRGRITQKDASFELEVTGPASKIKEFIRLSDTWGISVGASSVGVA